MLKPRVPIQNLHPYHSPIGSRAGLGLDLNEKHQDAHRVCWRGCARSRQRKCPCYPKREIGEQLVANFLGITPEQVLLTNGMDEALSLMFAAYLSARGDELLFADPTFVMYPMLGAGTVVRKSCVCSREKIWRFQSPIFWRTFLRAHG